MMPVHIGNLVPPELAALLLLEWPLRRLLWDLLSWVLRIAVGNLHRVCFFEMG